jgi:drug/metabolite transporter (DMT)-like permease
VLREPMTTSLLLGTLLVVTGVFLTNRRAPSAPNRAKPRSVRVPP